MTKLRIILLGTACLELTACTQYINRYGERIDTINISAGDALETNEAIMVPTPWPRYAYDTNIVADGERINRAVQRYREGIKQPIETLPEGAKKQFGSKFIDAGTGQAQQAPGKGFFVPAPSETSRGIPVPPPTIYNEAPAPGAPPASATPPSEAPAAPSSQSGY